MFGSSRRPAILLLAPVILAACGGEYEVRVRSATEGLIDDARLIEVAIVPDCASQPATGPIFAGDPVVRFTPGEEVPALGDVPEGDHGLFARFVSEDCDVVASGCQPITVDGKGGMLSVTVSATSGFSCAPGQSCGAGATCRSASDDGGVDAPSDVPADAPRDVPVDIPQPVDAGPDVNDAGADATEPDGGPTTCNPCATGLPIFPGAVGFGVCHRASFECTPVPRIIHVENLNPSGPGSLFEAMSIPNSIIVFDVSGVIDMGDAQLLEGSECQIVAGQTAPGPVVVRGNVQYDNEDNVLFQHITILSENVASMHALRVGNAENVTVDHVSLGYSGEANMRFSRVTNVTVMNSLMAMSTGDFSMSSAFGGGPVAYIGNIMAFYRENAPLTRVDSFLGNNVSYATPFRHVSPSTRSLDMVPIDVVVRDSSFLTSSDVGPSSAAPINGDTTGWFPENRIFTTGNFWDVMPMATQADLVTNVPPESVAATPPLDMPCYEGLPSDPSVPGSLVSELMGHAGARPTERTAFGDFVIRSLGERTGDITPTVADTPGYPTLPEVTEVSATPLDPFGDEDGDGYRNIEEWLHQQALDIE